MDWVLCSNPTPPPQHTPPFPHTFPDYPKHCGLVYFWTWTFTSLVALPPVNPPPSPPCRARYPTFRPRLPPRPSAAAPRTTAATRPTWLRTFGPMEPTFVRWTFAAQPPARYVRTLLDVYCPLAVWLRNGCTLYPYRSLLVGCGSSGPHVGQVHVLSHTPLAFSGLVPTHNLLVALPSLPCPATPAPHTYLAYPTCGFPPHPSSHIQPYTFTTPPLWFMVGLFFFFFVVPCAQPQPAFLYPCLCKDCMCPHTALWTFPHLQHPLPQFLVGFTPRPAPTPLRGR